MLSAPRSRHPGKSPGMRRCFSVFVNREFPLLPASGFGRTLKGNGEGTEIPIKNELTEARSYSLPKLSDPYRERIVHVRRKTEDCRTWGKRHPFQRSRAARSGR